MSRTKSRLQDIYRRLDRCYGDQHWWPGETPFEIAVGAILTQNTAWVNVERAIANLKAAGVLAPDALADLPPARLAALIRPSGYYNVKARRLRAFLKLMREDFGGDIAAMGALPLEALRGKLLAVTGIGPETADSIILYACGLPTFVVDAYTRRVLLRHGLADEDAGYDDIKELFESNLPADVPMYNQYHALLVRLGKERCRPRQPRCEGCPLEPLLTAENA